MPEEEKTTRQVKGNKGNGLQIEGEAANPGDKEVRAFLETAYRDLLGREIDKEGLDHYLHLLRDKNYSFRQIVRNIKNSEEYRILHARGETPALVIENLKLNHREILEGKSVLQSTPPTFNIDLIGLCNMNPPCAMCLNWSGDVGPRHHKGLTLKDLEHFGDFARLAYNVVNCSIGEPLILKDLIPILQLFSRWEKELGINSNGIALTPTMTDKLVPFFDILTITFSLDAATAESYARIRGNHFQRVIDNIAYYCQKRREVSPEGLPSKTGLVMIPMKQNRNEVVDFVRLAAKLGVDVVELRSLNQVEVNVRVSRGDFVFDYRQQMLSDQELEEVRREAEETAAQCGIFMDCQYQVSEEHTYAAFLPPEYRGLNLKCVQPWRFLLPYKNGDTTGCCYMGETLGNWRQTDLKDLWNSPRMQEIRKEMASGQLPKECRRYTSCPVVRAEITNITGPDKPGVPKESPASKNSAIIRQRILQREFQVSEPRRFAFMAKLIKKLRHRMAVEIAHVLEPVLENQKEINLRLLKEIEELKKTIASTDHDDKHE
jgi:MoaA/NifB/PqqE/SkfB family radical SAM enzyme